MTSLEIDGSLVFEFEDGWLAVKWDDSEARVARAAHGRKAVDVAAVRRRALLVEVKDDRAKSLESQYDRNKSVARGKFLEEMALKMRHTIEDLLSEEESDFAAAFVPVWKAERRRLVLWWERGPVPPSGSGTLDARWKAHWAAMTNQLKQQVADLTPRVLVGGRPFLAAPDEGIHVGDVPAGIARRRGRTET